MRIPSYLIISETTTTVPEVTTRFYEVAKFLPKIIKTAFLDEEIANDALNNLIYTDGERHYINWYTLASISLMVIIIIGLMFVFSCFFKKKIHELAFDPFKNTLEYSMKEKSKFIEYNNDKKYFESGSWVNCFTSKN